jgi:hypothetical protein
MTIVDNGTAEDSAVEDGPVRPVRDPDSDIGEVTARLRSTLDRRGIHPDAAMLRAIVADELSSFSDARVTTFVPVLVERAVLQRLRSAPATAVVRDGG